MKNSKRWFLTAVLVVTALTMAGQWSIAEITTPYNGTGLTDTFNSLFGSSADQALRVEHSGSFNTGTRFFEISASTINLTSDLSIFGSSPSSPFGNLSNYSPSLSLSNNLTGREITFDRPGSGLLNLGMSNDRGQYYSNLSTNPNVLLGWWGEEFLGTGFNAEINHFVYFDVTSLLSTFNLGINTAGATAYLVGFDSMIYYPAYQGGNYSNGDYNDAVFLVVTWTGGGNPDPDPSGVPEPATMFLWTLGGLSMAGASWRRNRNKKKLLA